MLISSRNEFSCIPIKRQYNQHPPVVLPAPRYLTKCFEVLFYLEPEPGAVVLLLLLPGVVVLELSVELLVPPALLPVPPVAPLVPPVVAPGVPGVLPVVPPGVLPEAVLSVLPVAPPVLPAVVPVDPGVLPAPALDEELPAPPVLSVVLPVVPAVEPVEPGEPAVLLELPLGGVPAVPVLPLPAPAPALPESLLQAPNVRVATSAASNTEYFISVPLKKI